MRKLFSILVALFATVSLLAHDFEIDKIYYNILSDTTVEVTYGGDSYWETYSADTIIIPSVVTYNGTSYSVVRIGSLAFYSCNISSITIPNSITSIGHNAFRYCRSLTTLIIPNGLESIEGGAFEECESLISITIPNSVTNIGGNAFYETGVYNDLSNWENDVLYIGDCLISTKTSISGAYEIKNQTRLIADGTFNECKSLTAITFPENVTSIGDITFWECSSLKSVIWNVKNPKNCGITFFNTPISSFIFGENVAYIPAGLCQSMKSLTSVIIPENVISIGDAAFYGCSYLTSITLPNSLTSIGSRAFDACSSLASIIIPYSVTDIGDYAFSLCYFSQDNFTNNSSLNAEKNDYWGARIFDADEVDGLFIKNDTIVSCRPYVNTITIPGTVKYIQGTPFSECWYRSSIVVESGNAIYDSRENCNAIIETATNTLILGCQNTIIPNTVTSIGNAAFYGCVSITSITIPRSVTSIGESAFNYCSSLTSITIPESVITIGGYAFEGTPWYNSKEDGVIYIGKVLYNYKGEMPANTSLDIIEGTLSISDNAFSNCNNLTSIYIPNSVTSIGYGAFIGCGSLKSITIPNSVTSIGAIAFYGCSSLTSVTLNSNDIVSTSYMSDIFGSQVEEYVIGNNVTTIGNSAFAYCSSLTSVTIPNSITTIGNSAFAYCSSLTSVTIPNCVTTIGGSAFVGCSSLTSITIPEGVTSIGSGAFGNCSSLKHVEWNVKNHTDFDYYNRPFDDQSSISIQSFTFGENVEYIPADLCYNMDSLKTITIPNSVDSIGGQAFYSCDSLVSVTIGNSVTSIGDYAFGNCSLLKYVEWNVKNYADFDYYNRPFRSSPAISSFTFGEDVEYIPAYLCYDMDSLKTITIPNSVDSIGGQAFYSCDSLVSVTIGNSVTSIGDKAFIYCDSLRFIFSAPLLPPAIESNVFSFNAYDNATLHVLSSDYKTHNVWKQFDSIQVADTIYSDGIRYKVINKSGKLLSESLLTEDSFNQFTRVSVAGNQTWRYDSQYGAKMSGFQDNVTHTNEDWFISPALDLEGCSSATLTFSHAFGPKSSIPTTDSQKAQYTIWVSNDFEGDVNAATWTELKGMIYGDTGWGFVSSGDITIPTENLKGNCRVAWKYVCENSSATWEIKNVSLSATIDTNTKPTLQVINGESPYSGDIAIPSVVKYMNADLEVASIGNIAFRNCSSLNSVTIENGITTIEEYAFYNSSLTSIYLPNTLTNIGYSAFRGCSSLISIAIPNGVTTIRNNTFSGCSFLTSATISNGVMAIDKYAFADCLSLNTISVPNSVTRIGQSTFKNCTSLVEVTLSNEMNTLEKETFQDCSSLKFVRLGGKLTTIGESVFSACTALNEITLPASVKSIGENAFAGCTKLYDIYCYAMEPPTAFESSFANYNAFLHVPCDNQRVYLLDILFGNFKYVECIEAETAPTDTVVVTPSFNDAEFIWPSNSSADSYTLAISKDGEIFCTLTFNANGQLTGIAFAPSRNGQHNAPAAAQTANGFAFTVTGLDEGANYTYDLLIQDRSGNTLQSYSGEFRTQSVDDRIIMVEYDATQGEVIGAGTYLLGDIVTLTVIPNEGYQFATWGDGNTDNPRTLVVTQDTTLTAVFEILTYNVTVTCDPIHGDVTGSGTYNHGDVATLTATPSDGYTFVEWGDGCTDNPRALVVTQDTILTAIFEILTYNVTVTYDPIHGSVTGSGTYNHGDVVTLTAIPNEGYQFVRWSNEVEDNPYTFVISDNVKLSAEFEAVIHSSVENTHSPSPTSSCQKIFRNGQLIIIRDGKAYNAIGQEM